MENGGLFTQEGIGPEDILEPLHWEVYNVESSDFKSRRGGRKIASDYAVSEFPFLLLVDEDGQEFAALYSEDGPITAERINDKL